MTTKEQERKALERIREILAGIDSDGWVNTAFAGVIDDAETNIANDWALSMADRYESANNKIIDLHVQLRAMEERAKGAEALANAKIESADIWCTRYHEAKDHADDLGVQLTEQIAKTVDLEERIANLELESMKLKAKLYDAIIGA